MNKRITLQKYGTYKDANGFSHNGWGDCVKLWAGVNNLFGKEYWEAKQCNMENTVVFTVRYSSYISALDTKRYRILWQGKIYNITGIDNMRYENNFVNIKAMEETKNE